MDDSGSVRPCRMIQWSKLKTLMHEKFENINPKKTSAWFYILTFLTLRLFFYLQNPACKKLKLKV